MTINQTTIALAAVALLLAGCGEKKKEDVIITEKIVQKAPAQPVRMQDYTQTKTVEWLRKEYRCGVERSADDSLAMVKDENGQKYYDNRIRLTIRRADNTVFFQRSFTKKSFDACLDDDYRTSGVLEGLVFDKAEGNSLRFAASVSHPQTDEYIPIVVMVSRMGELTFSRDNTIE